MIKYLLILRFFFVIVLLSAQIEGRQRVRVLNLSDRLVPFQDAWAWQTQLMKYQIDLQDCKSQSDAEKIVGHVLLLQHKSVYTLGTASESGSGPFSTTTANGDILEYEVFEIDRAGQATYHGPGQIVMYPILDLRFFEKDINTYLRGLEEMTIDTLSKYDITGTRKDALTGVWVGTSKVAAIGVKLRRWVTMHGVALNVDPDLRYFDNIVPCGISDSELSVGAIAKWVPGTTVSDIAPRLLESFTSHFDVCVEELSGHSAVAYLDGLTSQHQS
jgi:lipoyl(octanoyl) transferase